MSRTEKENVTTRRINAHDTSVKNEAYEFMDEKLRKAWDNIHETSTFENALRLNMASQNKKTKSRKELITKFILFSIIIGQVTIAKEIGGMMVQNKIQKGNLPSQYLVGQSDEEMIREQIDVWKNLCQMLNFHLTLRPSAGLKTDPHTTGQLGREHGF